MSKDLLILAVAIVMAALAISLSAWFYIDFSTNHDLAEPSVLAWFTDIRGILGSALLLGGMLLLYRTNRTRS